MSQSAQQPPVGVAVAGAGNWGKNLVRAFGGLNGCNLRWVCDVGEARLADVRRRYPNTKTTGVFEEVLADPEVQGVVIATPASTHAALAKQALLAGKDVMVEKPLCLTTADALELNQVAEAHSRVLMVGHLLVHHPAVHYLKALVERGELGDIRYLYSQRVNLGVIRSEENALWSFAPHDLSIIGLLVKERPRSIVCRGASYLQPGIQDVVFLNLHYPSGVMAQVQLSWLDPHKLRRITVVGSRKMALFDDVHPTDKIVIYDKGVTSRAAQPFTNYGEYLSIRDGDTVIPRLELGEPLALEAKHFIDRVRDRGVPATSGQQGLEVVQILEAAQRSMDQDGTPVLLEQLQGSRPEAEIRV